MKYAHGTNVGYTTGKCRCAECQRAHSDAQRSYRAGHRVLVSAKDVRRHIRSLSRMGVGIRSIHAATDLNLRSLNKLKKGTYRKVYTKTLELILAVDASAGPETMRISPAKARRAIREMGRHGLTHEDIAERAGVGRVNRKWIGDILRKPRIWVRTERKLLRALAEVRRELVLERELGEVCNECGLLHSQPSRVERLRRLSDCATFVDANEAWPCIYPQTIAGERLYYRDVDAMNGRVRKAA